MMTLSMRQKAQASARRDDDDDDDGGDAYTIHMNHAGEAKEHASPSRSSGTRQSNGFVWKPGVVCFMAQGALLQQPVEHGMLLNSCRADQMPLNLSLHSYESGDRMQQHVGCSTDPFPFLSTSADKILYDYILTWMRDALEYPPIWMGMANWAWKTGSVPSLPGKT